MILDKSKYPFLTDKEFELLDQSYGDVLNLPSKEVRKILRKVTKLAPKRDTSMDWFNIVNAS